MKSKGWLSYSNVVATVALFVALGGGAWALSKNSVGSREIKKSAVRSSEIDNGTVKGKDVRDETLEAGQIADGSIGGAELSDGSVGAGEIADGSVGSSKIPNNAVGAGEISGGAVGSSEIASNAVGSGKVSNGSLTGGDVAADSLTGAQIDESSLGIVPSATSASLFAGRELIHGSADSADTNVDVIAELPAIGAELRDDGTVDNDLEIVLANTGSSPKLKLVCPSGSPTASPGAAVSGTGTGTMVCFAWNNPAGPGRALILCGHDVGNNEIHCDILREG